MTDRSLTVPELSLVVLASVTGSGKSTFARSHHSATQILSSDTRRSVVADNETDQSATANTLAPLRRGLLAVVDATSVRTKDRAALVKAARDHDVLPVAIVLDLPEALRRERNTNRPDRTSPSPHVVTRRERRVREGLQRPA